MPTMEFTTKLGCSLACTFCPQIKLVKNYPRGAERMMTVETFRTIVDKLPSHVRIDFSGMSEPWLNPNATEMVSYAYDTGRNVAVYTTLEGLPPEEAAQLLRKYKARITKSAPWVVHLPDDQNNMPGWKASNRYMSTLATVMEFKNENPEAHIVFMTMSTNGGVHSAITGVFDTKLGDFVGMTRAENLKREEFSAGELVAAVQHKNPILCKSTPFFDHNGVLPNGDVVLCCMDYSAKNIIGNLLETNYEDLFVGPAMSAIKLKSMRPGYDENFICKNCDNAVCLSQGPESWLMNDSAYWGDAAGSRQEALSARAHQQYEARARESVERELADAKSEIGRFSAAFS